jgi:outer membrane immunogenic protein
MAMRHLTALAASLVLGASLIGSATAADLQPAYKAAPAPAPAFSWTGFYLGGHVGWGWGETNATPTGLVGLFVTPFQGDTDGVMAGATIGYNFQYGQIVLGAEGEFSWSDINGSSGGSALGFLPLTATSQNNWIATLSSRVGVAYDTVLIYGKAGVAWANNDYSYAANIGPFSFGSSISETETGWLVGGGIEWAFARNWSAKIEANYMDFGRKNRAFAGPGGFPINADIDSHISTVKFGVNYRFF